MHTHQGKERFGHCCQHVGSKIPLNQKVLSAVFSKKQQYWKIPFLAKLLMEEANSPMVLFEWKPKDGIVFGPKLFFWSGHYCCMYQWVLIWSSCVKIQKHPVGYQVIHLRLKLHSNGISMYSTSIFFLDKMQKGGPLSVTP